jgi:hypothetical protein
MITLFGIIVMLNKGNGRSALAAGNINLLIIASFPKIIHQRTGYTVFVKDVAIKKMDKNNLDAQQTF